MGFNGSTGGGQITNGGGSLNIKGDCSLGSLILGNFAVILAPASSKNLTSNGNTFVGSLEIAGTGSGQIVLQDALTVAGSLTLTSKDLLTNSHAITCGSFNSSNTNTRSMTLGFTSLILTGTGVVFDVSTNTNLSISASGAILIISDLTATGKTFKGGGKTYGGLDPNPSAGTGTITITGDNTFLAFHAFAPLILTGTTQTMNAMQIDASCTAITGGAIVQSSGTVTAPAGCTITNNTASGGATFDATAATLVGTTTGWTQTSTFQRSRGMQNVGNCREHGYISDLSTAKTLASGSGTFAGDPTLTNTSQAFVQAITNNVYYTTDGTVPSSTNGFVLYSGYDPVLIQGDLTKFKFIESTSSAHLKAGRL